MNIPNLISIARLAFVPLILALLHQSAFGWALVVFIAAAASDGLDGFLARYLDQQTDLGAVLDPVADKVLINAALFFLFTVGIAPFWFVALILARDILIGLGYLAFHLANRTDALEVLALGKMTTFAQMAFVSFLIWTEFYTSNLETMTPFLAVLCAALTLLSGAAYLWKVIRHIAKRA